VSAPAGTPPAASPGVVDRLRRGLTNPSLATRMRIGFGVLLVLLACVTIVGVGRLFDLRRDFEDQTSQSFQLELAAERLRSAFILQQSALRRPGGPGVAAGRAYREATALTADATRAARSLAASDPVARRLLDQRVEADARWRELIAKPILRDRDPPTPARERRLARAALDADAALIEGQRDARESQREEVRSDTRTTVLLVLAGLVASLLAAVLAFSGLVNSMSEPLSRLVGGARRLAGGDLEARVEVGGPEETEVLGRAFNEMAAELQRTFSERQRVEKMKDEFLATVSHELRTPVTAVKGFAELLMMERGHLTPDQRENVETILRSSEQLTGLLNDLLDMARSDAGRLEIHARACELAPIVDEAARQIAPRIREKGQRLDLEVEDGLPQLHAEPNRIEQVLTNLLTNAHKFTPVGGQIALNARGDDGWIELEVTDSGPGIPPSELPRVFDRFWRGDDSASQAAGGTGLGLPIARSLVELHGGTIRVTSTPGKGATFRLRLPSAS
jgi:signal transduction histidine kinase